ncbi:MAG TPA: PP0621 family protein [Marinospirillum sp.]|uniref:PP0621 family protein n=1 Tax=Marinospirillum sp. TaxID=2183934 RepID=UPI002B477DFF|nr:PP0621 family protein [Marinospirillum sp.]HKM16344.1 PP0621 family protein [Marinospirillum sp.]
MSLLIVRLVVFVLLFWVGFRIWQYWQTHQIESKNNQINKNEDGSETMVRCEKCQIHLPQGNAIKAGEYYFCCQEHQASFEKE